MTVQENKIVYKYLKETPVLSVHRNVSSKGALMEVVEELMQKIPQELIAGDAFCIFQFITSLQEGFDVEVCVPVTHMIEVSETTAKIIPSKDVLSLVCNQRHGDFSGSIQHLFRFANQHGLISDEFYREAYINTGVEESDVVEIQFVIHPWTELLAKNLESELGKQAMDQVMQGYESLKVFS